MRASRVITVILLLVLLLAGIGLYADVSSLGQALVDYAWWTVGPALALALANYVLRFGKWHFYLHAVGQRIPVRFSAQVFFSGLSMSVTPGKVGELLKSYLLKKSAGVPVAVSAPVVLAERLTDLLALLVLALFGVVTSGYGWDIMVVGTVLCGGVLMLALWRRAGVFVVDQLSRFKVVRERRESILELQEALFQLVGPMNLSVGTVISVVAWFAECLAFYLVLQGAGIDFSLSSAVFVYSLGTVAGAVTMLPGGLVATEASMVFVLVEVFGAATRPAAVTAVLVVRICTLWFAVLVGVAALGMVKRHLGKRDFSLAVRSVLGSEAD
jgi:glycosyltransferase 2 family protein